MAQGRNQQGSSRSRNNSPWRVLYPREYQVQSSHGGGSETRTEFMPVGVAFPLRDRQGFSLDLYLVPPAIDNRVRLVLMPRETEGDGQEGGR